MQLRVNCCHLENQVAAKNTALKKVARNSYARLKVADVRSWVFDALVQKLENVHFSIFSQLNLT